MARSAKVIGSKELLAKFKQLEKQMQGKTLANAAFSGALLIQNSAVNRCPVDVGTLHDSIHSEIAQSSDTYAEIEIGTDVEYAPFVELGTRHMVAQPYLRPALDEESDSAVKEIGSALWQQINSLT